MTAAFPITQQRPAFAYVELLSIFTDFPETLAMLRAFNFAREDRRQFHSEIRRTVCAGYKVPSMVDATAGGPYDE